MADLLGGLIVWVAGPAAVAVLAGTPPVAAGALGLTVFIGARVVAALTKDYPLAYLLTLAGVLPGLALVYAAPALGWLEAPGA